MKIGWEGNETVNPEETIQLGENLASYLEQGDVLALVGDLASGKTHRICGEGSCGPEERFFRLCRRGRAGTSGGGFHR